MRVTALWYGGSSYAAPSLDDAESFRSIKAARDAFWSRADWDPYYPCVDAESCEMQLFLGVTPEELSEMRDPYPDRLIRMGPRGGVRIERC